MSQKLRILLSIFFFSYFTLPFSLLYALGNEYSLGPQDVLKIEVWDNSDLSREATVSFKGTISFPLIGEIAVEGLGSEQIQEIIRSRLADGFLVNPQVTVTVKEYNSQKIYVLGEVNKPGYYPFSKATTMVELISMAGGLTPDAGQEASILRSVEEGLDEARQKIPNLETNLLPEDISPHQVITINLNDFNQGINLDIELQNNDTLSIPKAKFFYVVGEVMSPGRYKLEKKVNVLQAISTAKGLTQKANMKKATIIRTVDGKNQELSVGETDLVSPDDIITVPESFF